MNIRICHVCSGHRDDDGRVFDHMCTSLAEVGYEVHLMASSTRIETYQTRGVFIHPVPKYKNRCGRLRNRYTIAKMAADIKPDLYHVHEPELLGPVLRIAGNKPVIWDVHEPYLDYLSAKVWIPVLLRPLARSFWDWQERKYVSKCRAIITTVESIALRYRNLHETVSVISNFPRVDNTKFLSYSVKEEGALVFTGVLAPNRGIDDVIRAMGLLKQRGVFTRLHLAGEGYYPSYVNELMSIAEQEQVVDNVIFYGLISKQDAIALQRLCSIGLNISNNKMYAVQGYPVKMFEFMQAGIPVIYSNYPSFIEIAGTTQAGIAVEPGYIDQIANAIETLLKDHNLSRLFGENGKKAVENKFNWENESNKLINLYQKILGT